MCGLWSGEEFSLVGGGGKRGGGGESRDSGVEGNGDLCEGMRVCGEMGCLGDFYGQGSLD